MKIWKFLPDQFDNVLPNELLIFLCHFLHSIRGSFATFGRFLESSEESNSLFFGGTVAMVSKQKDFPADVTVAQTL
jgi:hypothetical protein